MNTNSVTIDYLAQENSTSDRTTVELSNLISPLRDHGVSSHSIYTGIWNLYEERIEELQKQLDDFKMKLQMLMDMLPDDDIDVGELL